MIDRKSIRTAGTVGLYFEFVAVLESQCRQNCIVSALIEALGRDRKRPKFSNKDDANRRCTIIASSRQL